MQQGVPDLDSLEEVLPQDLGLGRPVQVFPLAVTTESLAMGWARQQQAPEGAIVVADAELSARARRGPPWVSVPGKSLAFSVVLRPELPPEGEGLLWLLAALGAAEGIEAVADINVPVKWPDDLLVDDRRLGMVRSDAHLGPGRIESAVVTVRVNVGLTEDDFPAEHRETATSLALEGVDRPRPEVLASILARLEACYGMSVPELLDAYRSRCSTLGRQVRAQLMPVGEAAGRAADVDERGALVVEGPGGRGFVSVGVVKRLEVVG